MFLSIFPSQIVSIILQEHVCLKHQYILLSKQLSTDTRLVIIAQLTA